jgi:arsenite methyltransferase
VISDQPVAAGLSTCLYEQPALREPAGNVIRPGGLALTDTALALCALPPGARVLDVGCGTGATVEHLRARHGLAAFGLDLSAALLRAHSGGEDFPRPLIQAPAERLPVGAGQFDALLAECSLSAMAETDRVLAEFERVLRPGGMLIVTDLYARNADAVAAADTSLSGARSQAQIAERLQAHGFQITLWQDHSAALKQLAVQLIMTQGALPPCWPATTTAATAERGPLALKVKLGYYLLLARKGGA